VWVQEPTPACATRRFPLVCGDYLKQVEYAFGYFKSTTVLTNTMIVKRRTLLLVGSLFDRDIGSSGAWFTGGLVCCYEGGRLYPSVDTKSTSLWAACRIASVITDQINC
jgi:hypothetical protein